MTDLQRAEFDLLKYFIEICDKLDLKYFLVCGSTLGAVKYGGFIPWDDDVDVALEREDYEIFCDYAQAMLPPNIFLQNYKTDPAFPHIYSKLRNSNTTYIETSARNLNINHGIYIDIFPLDGYPKAKVSQILFELKKSMFESIILSAYDIQRTVKGNILHKIYNFLRIQSHTIASKYDQMVKRYKVENSTIIANHGNWQGKLEYSPREQYGSGTTKEFETLKVRVPEQYDEYLTQKYGDWTKELPKEKQVGHHHYIACDTKIPYTAFIGGKENE